VCNRARTKRSAADPLAVGDPERATGRPLPGRTGRCPPSSNIALKPNRGQRMLSAGCLGRAGTGSSSDALPMTRIRFINRLLRCCAYAHARAASWIALNGERVYRVAAFAFHFRCHDPADVRLELMPGVPRVAAQEGSGRRRIDVRAGKEPGRSTFLAVAPGVTTTRRGCAGVSPPWRPSRAGGGHGNGRPRWVGRRQG
jgi:hypothetical protein